MWKCIQNLKSQGPTDHLSSLHQSIDMQSKGCLIWCQLLSISLGTKKHLKKLKSVKHMDLKTGSSLICLASRESHKRSYFCLYLFTFLKHRKYSQISASAIVLFYFCMHVVSLNPQAVVADGHSHCTSFCWRFLPVKGEFSFSLSLHACWIWGVGAESTRQCKQLFTISKCSSKRNKCSKSITWCSLVGFLR